MDVPNIEPWDNVALVQATKQTVGHTNVFCIVVSHSGKYFSLLKLFQHILLSPT